MALNTEVFPHDSADLPRAGPGRMCSAAPTVPRTAHWARHRRPDTPDPAARATTPRGSPEKPRPGVRPRRRPHLTTPNPASEPRRLLGGRWCGGGGASLGASLSMVANSRGAAGGFMAAPSCLDHLSSVGPPGSRNTVVQRNLSGPTAFKWSKQSGRVTTCETPSHHARRSAGRSRGGALAPHPSARAARLLGPDDPSEPDRRSRRARLPQHTRRRLVLLLDRVALEPTPPTHPETTRTGHHGWPRFPALRAPPTRGHHRERRRRPLPRAPCPSALNDPSHHTRQTRPDAPEQPPGRGRLAQADHHRNFHAPRLQNHP